MRCSATHHPRPRRPDDPARRCHLGVRLHVPGVARTRRVLELAGRRAWFLFTVMLVTLAMGFPAKSRRPRGRGRVGGRQVALLRVRVSVLLAGHLRRDLAGSNRVRRDAVRAELQRQRLHHHPQPALGGAAALPRSGRCSWIEVTAISRPPYACSTIRRAACWRQRNAPVRSRSSVRRQASRLEFQHGCRVGAARVVDEHVDAAQFGGERLDGPCLVDIGLEIHLAHGGPGPARGALRGGALRACPSPPWNVRPTSAPRSASSIAGRATGCRCCRR